MEDTDRRKGRQWSVKEILERMTNSGISVHEYDSEWWVRGAKGNICYNIPFLNVGECSQREEKKKATMKEYGPKTKIKGKKPH